MMMKIQAASAKTMPSPDAQQTRVGVAVFLISPTGQFLVMRRKSDLGLDTWGLVGGHAEFGEDPYDTAEREVYEEVGIRLRDLKLMDVTNAIIPPHDKHYVTLFFAARVADIGFAQNKEPEKQAELRWIYHDELPDNLFLPLQNFVNKLGPDGLRHMLATFPR